MRYKLKPYMAFFKGFAHEGACLVFARNYREARNVSWREVGIVWYGPEAFTEWRVKLLDKEDWDYFYEHEAIREKLDAGVPHTIDCPTVCKYCGTWGGKLIDGVCEYCLSNSETKEGGGI